MGTKPEHFGPGVCRFCRRWFASIAAFNYDHEKRCLWGRHGAETPTAPGLASWEPYASLAVYSTLAIAAKLWARVRTGHPDECWPWMASVDRQGYGNMTLPGVCGARGRSETTHRLAWILTRGVIPPGGHYGTTCVCHSCDNPRCCNPWHLFLGSHADNMQDKARKGRGNRAKLTPDAVRSIREEHKAGERIVALAAKYHVTESAIVGAIKRVNWRHVA